MCSAHTFTSLLVESLSSLRLNLVAAWKQVGCLLLLEEMNSLCHKERITQFRITRVPPPHPPPHPTMTRSPRNIYFSDVTAKTASVSSSLFTLSSPQPFLSPTASLFIIIIIIFIYLLIPGSLYSCLLSLTLATPPVWAQCVVRRHFLLRVGPPQTSPE